MLLHILPIICGIFREILQTKFEFLLHARACSVWPAPFHERIKAHAAKRCKEVIGFVVCFLCFACKHSWQLDPDELVVQLYATQLVPLG
jgi:hypothetical protein